MVAEYGGLNVFLLNKHDQIRQEWAKAAFDLFIKFFQMTFPSAFSFRQMREMIKEYVNRDSF